MKKSAVVTTILMSAALIVVEAWLLATPVEAADCTANCAGGGSVQCSGHTCSANDGVGCTAWDQQGRVLIQMTCNNY
jgi:hypothetical protein